MWQAGIGKRCINPDGPIWLDGWASRTEASKGVSGDIFVKALALRDAAGYMGVLVTSDLMAIGRTMSQRVADKVCADHRLTRSQFIWNVSHSHSSPIVADSLPLYWDLPQKEYDVIERWTAQVEEAVYEAVADAINDLQPAELGFEQGLAGIAVNRRRARKGGRKLTTLTDPDVPVMTLGSPEGNLRGILFGYACHTTAVNDMKVNGDYAGWASALLEKEYPDVKAMFISGCGADANPLPRHHGNLWQHYGHILAEAVKSVIAQGTQPLNGRLRTATTTATIELQTPPDRTFYERKLASSTDGTARRAMQHQLDKLDRNEPLMTQVPYDIHTWRFGEALTFIGLTGEVVCDYALRFKQAYGPDNTWVAGYCNELFAYVPSRRVLEEGGYEGRTGMAEYGHAAPFRSSVEEIIASSVDELIRAIGGDPVGDRFSISE